MYIPTPGVGVAVVANSVAIEEIVPPTVVPNNIIIRIILARSTLGICEIYRNLNISCPVVLS